MEELIKKIMAECEEDGEPVTEAEAREMAEMEIKAKGIKNYTSTEKNRKPKAPRTKKVADEKKLLFQTILANLQEVFGENVEILNENKLIFVKVGNESFKVDIIQSRKTKK